MDGGAWWAAVYGVTQSRTRLKRLSSSSSTLPSGFPHRSFSKESAYSAGDLSSIPGSGRSSGEGNGYPLQYSCLENPMDRETWRATVHGVTKSQTQLKQLSMLHNNSSKRNKILTKRFNKRSARLIHCKLQNIIDRT